MKALIVTADDYGLSRGISRGILRAHRTGIVTATSVLAVAPAFRSTSRWLRGEAVSVGVHLALVGEDPPVLAPREIPSLVDAAGAFPRSWRSLLSRYVRGRLDLADVERECAAQIAAVRSAVGRVSYLNTHQHVHLLPGIGNVVLSWAARNEIGAVRVPRSYRRGAVGVGTNVLAARFARQCRRRGVVTTDAFEGLDHAGAMTLPRLVVAIRRLAHSRARSAEIVTHPGEPTEVERYRWGYQWSAELEALTATSARDEVTRLGFSLTSWEALARYTPEAA
jgi:predicted glycoside hydrolase/deacetylase ChbG (UPF0249 family)